MFVQQVTAWRALHSQGRGLYLVLLRDLPDIDSRTVREAEMSCNTIIGFNFGDGHLHNEDLIRAIQSEAQFEPGEFVVVWVESQPIHKRTQEYKVIDAALGVVERGTWNVADLVAEQPWLPNGPILYVVTWRHPEYLPADQRASTSIPSSPGAEGPLVDTTTASGHDETPVGAS